MKHPVKGARIRVTKREPLVSGFCHWAERMDEMDGLVVTAAEILPGGRVCVVHRGNMWYLVPHWYEVL